MNGEDPLFLLYTSGSTGKPKGMMHTTAGYLLWAAFTHQYTFDYRPGEVYACVADIGWITGHSYIVYGPLCNAATTVMFESLPTYPDAGRYWDLIQRHNIASFYTVRDSAAIRRDSAAQFSDAAVRPVSTGAHRDPRADEVWDRPDQEV